MANDMSDPSREIAACRRDMAELAVLWQSVAARSAPGARVEAEAQVFNQMVVALDSRFGATAADAPVAREVRLLARGVANGGWFPADGQAEGSVTGYVPGDRIALDSERFWQLAGMFLDGVAGQVSAS